MLDNYDFEFGEPWPFVPLEDKICGGDMMFTESEILADVIASDEGDLAPSVAQSLLRWKFTDRAVARMNDLAARNNCGTLSNQELQELEQFLRVGSLVNLLQAKARRSLNSASQAGA